MNKDRKYTYRLLVFIDVGNQIKNRKILKLITKPNWTNQIIEPNGSVQFYFLDQKLHNPIYH